MTYTCDVHSYVDIHYNFLSVYQSISLSKGFELELCDTIDTSYPVS